MKDIPAKDVRWNLSELYSSPEDPELQKDLAAAKHLAEALEKKYKPLFENPDASREIPMTPLLSEYKEILTLMTRAGTYAGLSFAVQTQDAETGAFYQKIQVTLTDIRSHLLFFPVYWNTMPQARAEKIMAQPGVEKDRHFLEQMRVYAPHTLAEGEEKIMALKDNTSRHAFTRLFDEFLNNIPFEIELNGEKHLWNESRILALFHSHDRTERQRASESLGRGLAANTHILNYIYNMILADHRTAMKIRRYKHPLDSRNLANETDREAVMNLIHSVKEAYPLAQRYYRLKGRLLGLEKMMDYDRYAPVRSHEQHVSFEECRKIVCEGYYEFSKDFGEMAQQFFDGRWIDAEVRDGKRGGGFCCATTPELHPFILVNYMGTLRDVMTVAHELGHGIHQYLAGKRVGILESSAPLTMAETASVFGEMLIFERVLDRETDPRSRLALLCEKIDDNFATVYRQIALTDFELRVHEAGLEKGELTSGQLSDFWIEANAELYGDSVELSPEYRHGWKYIPHFVHSPFYCYAYSFAQLFVLSLYQKYRSDKPDFLPRYVEILSLGGSKSPGELAQIAGLDIHAGDFWKLGLSLLENLVTQAEELAASSAVTGS